MYISHHHGLAVLNEDLGKIIVALHDYSNAYVVLEEDNSTCVALENLTGGRLVYFLMLQSEAVCQKE